MKTIHFGICGLVFILTGLLWLWANFILSNSSLGYLISLGSIIVSFVVFSIIYKLDENKNFEDGYAGVALAGFLNFLPILLLVVGLFYIYIMILDLINF